MTPAAEKDIRSALRQLRGCRGRLAMARTAVLSDSQDLKVALALIETDKAQGMLLALLGAEGTKR